MVARLGVRGLAPYSGGLVRDRAAQGAVRRIAGVRAWLVVGGEEVLCPLAGQAEAVCPCSFSVAGLSIVLVVVVAVRTDHPRLLRLHSLRPAVSRVWAALEVVKGEASAPHSAEPQVGFSLRGHWAW